MRLDAFDFTLPDANIALRPIEPRDAARMLVIRPETTEALSHSVMRDLPTWLSPGDVLVVNDTRVIAAQHRAMRSREGIDCDGGPVIDLTLHKRVDAQTWLAFAKPGRKLAIGDRLLFGDPGSADRFSARVLDRSDHDGFTLAFDRAGPDLDAAIAAHGIMPLPPYIAGRRATDDGDRGDYQTMFAAWDGAVAAPTAGLHFTPALRDALNARGIGIETVTLHVGAGTFLPVKVDDIRDHRMHAEWACLPDDVAARLNAVRARGGRIVAVGTTSLRTLESAVGADGRLHGFTDDTAIFITPGHVFRSADALVTNFHLPRSTLFMLVSAFCGLETMQSAYRHAIDAGYRFYSYGDGSLLFRARASS